MFDDLHTYYCQHVVESFVSYRKAKYCPRVGRNEDLRLAIDAAEALFHLYEHLPKGISLTRRQLEGLCTDFRLLADVANVTKHRSLDRPTPQGPPLVSDATQITERVVLTEYQDEIGIYRRSGKEVLVKLDDGSERDLFDVLISVINFWESYLHTNGVLNDVRVFKRLDEPEPRPRLSPDLDDDELQTHLMRGERFMMGIALRRYNYEAGTVEPVDLTGAKFGVDVWTAPRKQLDFVLTHSATGRECRATVVLAPDEEFHHSRLNNDEAKNNYLRSLPKVRDALQDLARQKAAIELELAQDGSLASASPDAVA